MIGKAFHHLSLGGGWAGCWFVLVLVYKPKGETIEWFNDLPSLEPGKCIQWPITFDWTGRIPLKLEVFLISKNEKRFKCRRICPWQGAASFPPSLARPPSLKKLTSKFSMYIYIYTYICTYEKNFIIILKTKRTYLYFLGGWFPQSKHSAIESLQPIETTCQYAVIILLT